MIHVHQDELLIGVIDGAGHGDEAAATSQLASALLKRHAGNSLDSILKYCHDGLCGARGAAISVAAFNTETSEMTWAGIGNVEGAFLCRKDATRILRETLLLRNGVVGYRFSAPRISRLPVHEGDLLIFATDGIAANFLDGFELDNSAQAIADAILSLHAKGTDDALALVVRFLKRTV